MKAMIDMTRKSWLASASLDKIVNDIGFDYIAIEPTNPYQRETLIEQIISYVEKFGMTPSAWQAWANEWSRR